MYKLLTSYILILLIALFSTNVSANEVMADRCGSDVAIVPNYNARPDTPSTVILHRDSSGWTDWTTPFTVELSGAGRIRWWCNSTTGNWIESGAWRIAELALGTACSLAISAPICAAIPDIHSGSSVWSEDGWTAERSRCDTRSNRIRARLGPGDLLQIECLPGMVTSPLPDGPPASICSDTVQGKIAWDYDGSRDWYSGNIAQLCNGAEDTQEPAWCFLHVMHGGVNWGVSTFWNWQNALDLCEGTQNAAATISCFETQIDRGSTWQDAIATCDVR